MKRKLSIVIAVLAVACTGSAMAKAAPRYTDVQAAQVERIYAAYGDTARLTDRINAAGREVAGSNAFQFSETQVSTLLHLRQMNSSPATIATELTGFIAGAALGIKVSADDVRGLEKACPLPTGPGKVSGATVRECTNAINEVMTDKGLLAS